MTWAWTKGNTPSANAAAGQPQEPLMTDNIDKFIIGMTNEELARHQIITQRVIKVLDKQDQLTDKEENLVHVTVALVMMELKKWDVA